MGSVLAKGAIKPFDDPRVVNQRMKALEDELARVKSKREHEIRAQNRRTAFFAMKEGEWKRERKQWEEEVSRLKKRLEEKEEVIRQLEEEESAVVVGKKEKMMMNAKEVQMFDASLLVVEQMRAEQVRREEAVEKWKRLYLAIKTELDELIRRTAQDQRPGLRLKAGVLPYPYPRAVLWNRPHEDPAVVWMGIKARMGPTSG